MNQAQAIERGTRPPFDVDRMTREEAARFLGLEVSTLEADVSRRKLAIPFYRIGRLVYYRRSELEAWVEARRCGNIPRAIPIYPEKERR